MILKYFSKTLRRFDHCSWTLRRLSVRRTVASASAAFYHWLLFFCHQFWWKFWWFDKIGEFLSDKNITNSGDNNSFRFWVFFVTNFGENFSESLKLSIKKSPKLAKIQGNHQNWWQFCRKSMWAPIWEGGRGGGVTCQKFPYMEKLICLSQNGKKINVVKINRAPSQDGGGGQSMVFW